MVLLKHQPVRCLPTCMSQGQVVWLGGCQGDVAVAALVADPTDLSQHPHGLLARLRLHRVTSQVRVTTVTSLKLLLLAPPLLTLVLNLVHRVVLIQERRHPDDSSVLTVC